MAFQHYASFGGAKPIPYTVVRGMSNWVMMHSVKKGGKVAKSSNTLWLDGVEVRGWGLVMPWTFARSLQRGSNLCTTTAHRGSQAELSDDTPPRSAPPLPHCHAQQPEDFKNGESASRVGGGSRCKQEGRRVRNTWQQVHSVPRRTRSRLQPGVPCAAVRRRGAISPSDPHRLCLCHQVGLVDGARNAAAPLPEGGRPRRCDALPVHPGLIPSAALAYVRAAVTC